MKRNDVIFTRTMTGSAIALTTAARLIASVDITAPADNAGDITVTGSAAGGAGTYALEPGETRMLDGVDLAGISVNGAISDVVKVFGNTV